MSEKKSGRKATMVYVNWITKKRFQRSIFDVDHLRCDGKPADQSNITAALWQWFSTLSAAEARAFLQGQFPPLEMTVRKARELGEEEEVLPDLPSHDVGTTPTARGTKGRSA